MTLPFLIGILFGSLLTLAFLALSYLVLTKNQARTKQIFNNLEAHVKKKGSIIEPENEQVSNWVKHLPSNDN